MSRTSDRIQSHADIFRKCRLHFSEEQHRGFGVKRIWGYYDYTTTYAPREQGMKFGDGDRERGREVCAQAAGVHPNSAMHLAIQIVVVASFAASGNLMRECAGKVRPEARFESHVCGVAAEECCHNRNQV